MRFLIIIITLFSVAYGQVESDSIPFTDYDVHLYSLEYWDKIVPNYTQDTILDRSHLLNPIYNNSLWPMHMGFYGSPVQYFNHNQGIGFNVSRNVFDPYIIHERDLMYTKERVPYTSAKFSFSVPRGQFLEVKNTLAFNDFIQFGFNYTRTASLESVYSSQKSDIKNGGAFIHFRSSSRRYNGILSYINNNWYAQANGGIENVFKDSVALNGVQDPFLIEGFNQGKSRSVVFKQSYELGVDTLEAVTDSTFNRRFMTKAKLIHELGYHQNHQIYSDQGMNYIDSFKRFLYPNIHFVEWDSSSDGTVREYDAVDSLGHDQLFNYFGFQWFKKRTHYDQDSNEVVNLDRFFSMGVRNELNTVSQYALNLGNNYLTNMSIDGSFYQSHKLHRSIKEPWVMQTDSNGIQTVAQYRKVDKSHIFDLNIDFERYIAGFNKDNQRLELKLQHKQNNTSLINEVSVWSRKYNTYFYQERWRSNALIQNQYLKDIFTFGGRYAVSHARWKNSLFLQQDEISNYVYNGADFYAKQKNDDLLVRKLGYTQAIDWRNLHFFTKVELNMVSDTVVYPIPQWINYSSLHYQTLLFKKRMILQFGAESTVFGAYYAPRYVPVLQDFAIQSNERIGAYPVMNVFLNMQVNMARFFVRVHHLNKVNRVNYFLIPFQPMASETPFIEMGVHWKFLN